MPHKEHRTKAYHTTLASMSSVALMMPSRKPLMASSQYIHTMVMISCQPEAASAAVGGVSQYLTTRAASRFSSSTARTSEALVAMEMT